MGSGTVAVLHMFTCCLSSSRVWLQEMVASVCVSVSELEAAEAVATLLLHCQHTDKVSPWLSTQDGGIAMTTLLPTATAGAACNQ